MKTLYLDGSNGAAGDMILGSLLMQVEQRQFLEMMEAALPQLEIEIQPVQAGEIAGLSVFVLPKKDVQERHLHDIIKIIRESGLPGRVQDDAVAVFERLAGVEAEIHGVDREALHFHEVGALDSIGDIVGACLLFDLLGADRVVCSPLNLGTGRVECAHGMLDVPVPAVRALLEGIPTLASGPGERTTPTAAALLTHFAEFQDMGFPKGISTGYGFGKRVSKDGKNYLTSTLVIN